MKDPDAKKTIAKNLVSLVDPTMMDLESGAFKAKKAKREKTPVETALSDLKAFEKKILYCKLMASTIFHSTYPAKFPL